MGETDRETWPTPMGIILAKIFQSQLLALNTL